MPIPIIGQPSVQAWFMTVLIKCPCGQPVLWVGQPGMRSLCAGCQRIFQLVGPPQVTPNGELAWPLSVEVQVRPCEEKATIQ